jgi:hypothetical protein
MKVKVLCTGNFNAGFTNVAPVRLENTGGDDTIVIQFRNEGNLGDMLLQGRLDSSAPWVTITSDSSGTIQLVVKMTEYRIRINNTTGGVADYYAWIGG